MKAKMYVDGDSYQIATATRLYSNLEGENIDDFQFRVHQLILTDLDANGVELEDGLQIVVIDADYLSDFTDGNLKDAYRIAKSPVQMKLLEDTMNDRLIDFSDIRKAVKAPALTRTLEEAKASPEWKEAVARRDMIATWKDDDGTIYSGIVGTPYFNNAHTVINYNVKLSDGKTRSVSENKKPTFKDC